jgi:hypothetical protein
MGHEASNTAGLKFLVAERQDMLLPLRLYIMADQYDVPALRLLARDRFYRAAEMGWEVADDFPDIVDYLYENTPDTEVAMREIVCRLVGSRIQAKQVRVKMDRVMRKHGDFAVGVMNYTWESMDGVEFCCECENAMSAS